MKDLIIMGAGDLGKDVAWLVERINEKNPEWNLLGFTEKGDMKEFQGYPVLGGDEVIADYPDAYVICDIANSKVRDRITSSLPENVKIATLIDPEAMVHKTAQIEEGSMVFARTLVGVGAKVKKHSIVLYNASVNHDVELGKCTTVYPNASISGKVTVGDLCEVGSGCAIIQGVNICSGAKIAVGAAVFTNIENPGTVVGNPAVTMGGKKK